MRSTPKININRLRGLYRRAVNRREETIKRMSFLCGNQRLPRVHVRQAYRAWALDWEQAILKEIVGPPDYRGGNEGTE